MKSRWTIRSIDDQNLPQNLLKETIISDYYYVYIIAVEPEVARKGYGTILMNEIIKLAEKEKKQIILDTFNKNNLKFYKKFGF